MEEACNRKKDDTVRTLAGITEREADILIMNVFYAAVEEVRRRGGCLGCVRA